MTPGGGWLVWLAAAMAACVAHAAPPTASTLCSDFGYVAGTVARLAGGQVDLARCVAGPVHPPAALPPQAPQASCGNGHVDTAPWLLCPPCGPSSPCTCTHTMRNLEVCDGRDLQHQSCTSLGFLGGQLACTQRCTFDIRGCRVLAEGRKLSLPELGGLPSGTTVAISATPRAVGLAWSVRPDRNRLEANVVFAWADPALRVLHATHPADAGEVVGLALGGNASGWLIATALAGSSTPPWVRVIPVSPQGVIGTPGKPVVMLSVSFVVRGGPGEPSLVGGTTSLGDAVHSGGTALEIWLVDVHGDPLGAPVQIGPALTDDEGIVARAAYLGGGRFVVARGSTNDPAIAVAIVDDKGQTHSIAMNPDVRGIPLGLAIARDRITCVFAHYGQPGASIVTVSADGTVDDGPRVVTKQLVEAVVGTPGALALITRERLTLGQAPLVRELSTLALTAIGGTPRTLLGGPELRVPDVASVPSASYALVVTSDEGFVMRVR